MAKSKAKFSWENKIINAAQVGGIETSVLDNGPGRGVRIAWINTGSGLRYKVVIDRCLDIVDAFYNQYSLAWISHNGVVSPRPDSHRDLEWLNTFGGGLMTTCGLSHMGPPESDEYGVRGLHGRASNLAATVESIIQPDPLQGKLDMSITAVVKESRVFGPNLELRRTISSKLGEATIKVHDVVTNCGNTAADHMMLYHCNFGWPLVDEGADIIWKGECKSRGLEMDNKLFNSKHNYRKCQKPLESHRGGGESCGFIDVAADKKNNCTVGIYNPKIRLGLAMKYNKKQLPCLTNWQHWGFGEYVCALEPGTNPPIGQGLARNNRQLVLIASGKSKIYDLEFTIGTSKNTIL